MFSCEIDEDTQVWKEKSNTIQSRYIKRTILSLIYYFFALTLVGVNSDGAECLPRDGPTYIGHYKEGYLRA